MSSTSRASAASERDDGRPKFTRGEKCIFIHLVVTFSFILLLILLYFMHLCVVSHSLRDVLKITRRTTSGVKDDHPRTTTAEEAEAVDQPAGHVYLSDAHAQRPLCGALLLRARWSLAPAHCVAARTDPDAAHALPAWRARYMTQRTFVESKIKRSIPHPHFSREDFSNNVGLLEHVDPIQMQHYVFPPSGPALTDDILQQYESGATLYLYGWAFNSSLHQANVPQLIRYEVQPVAHAKCVDFMKPILDIRSYEHCVLLKNGLEDGDNAPDHGSVLVVGTTIVGMFGWGEKSGKGAPCIVLDLQFFKMWLENIIAW
ncbi:hypothetical protein O0L34_g2205 [Tuta absoluta]|nr:hypothetical protein O0L34_g2205 [Tuta absoluta]